MSNVWGFAWKQVVETARVANCGNSKSLRRISYDNPFIESLLSLLSINPFGIPVVPIIPDCFLLQKGNYRDNMPMKIPGIQRQGPYTSLFGILRLLDIYRQHQKLGMFQV